MKKITLLLLSLITLNFISSQNYRSTTQNTDLLYKGMWYTNQIWAQNNNLVTGNYVLTLKTDSSVQANNDSIFYYHPAFKASMNATYTCYRQYDTAFSGPKMILRPNKEECFLNSQGDTLHLRGFAALNQPYTFYTFPNGDYIEAKVSSIVPYTIFGQADSVKIIDFSTYNSGGTPIAGMMNYHHLQLSKNHGLIKTKNWYYFPYDTTSVYLTGNLITGDGTQLISSASIYNFAPGDYFEYQTFPPAFIPPPGNYSEVFHSKKILAKSVSANADTLIYTVETANLTRMHISVAPFINDIYTQDTVTEKILVNHSVLGDYSPTLSLDSNFIGNPLQFYSPTSNQNAGSTIQFSGSGLNGHAVRFCDFNYNPFPSDTCINQLITSCNYYNWFAEGLGLVDHYPGGLNTCQETKMIYYTKGTETWGTSIDWSTLLSMKEVEKNSAAVFPNPSNGNFTLRTNFTGEVRMEIFNSTGQLILSRISNTSEIIINDLPEGMYHFRIHSATGRSANGKLTVIH